MSNNRDIFAVAIILLGIFIAGNFNGGPAAPQEVSSQIKISGVGVPRELALADASLSFIGNNSAQESVAAETPRGIVPSRNFPEVNSAAILVEMLSNNHEIFSFRPNIRRPLASLTKLMTAVIALENVGGKKIVTLADDDILAEGDAGGFASGEKFTVDDLITAMFTVSSNDAASAIARFYGTSQFVAAMKAKAELLNMRDTTFSEPTGLSVLNQSTAEDLRALARYVLENHPEILKFSAEATAVIHPISDDGKVSERELKNINNFAGREDFLGGKTGYTEDANGNLISIFEYNGRKILIIVLGTDDRFEETEKLYNWAKSVIE